MYLRLASVGEICYSPGSIGYLRQHPGHVSNRLQDNLAEVIDTQRRVAKQLKFSPAALRRWESSTRYVYGEYVLRQGDWRTGVRLTAGNITAVPSVSALAERDARIGLVGVTSLRGSVG